LWWESHGQCATSIQGGIIMDNSLDVRMSYAGRVLKSYPWIVGLVSVFFLAVYLFCDFREGGRRSSLETLKLSNSHKYINLFGARWFYGMIAANIVLAALTGVVATTATVAYMNRRSSRGAACSVGATTALAFATFGCPGCLMPFVGTIGATAFANTLPLFGFEFKIAAAAILLGALYWQSAAKRRVDFDFAVRRPNEAAAALA
jgi:hypothetical protein